MFFLFLNLTMHCFQAQSQEKVTGEELPNNPTPMDIDEAPKPTSPERTAEPAMVSEHHHSENPTAEVSIFTDIIDILNDILSWTKS